MKGQLFVAMLTVQTGLLIRIFGKRFGSGWRSHVQQIALGLSTNALGLLAVQGVGDVIKKTVKLTSRAEYDRVIHLLTHIDDARYALWVLVLLWWMVWLWHDEPGSTSPARSTESNTYGDSPALESDPEPDVQG
jgi:hypothetical protein